MIHLLCHGASVYNCYLRGPVTLTPNAKRLAVELSLFALRLRTVANGIQHPTFRLQVERSYPLRHRRGPIS